MKKLLTLLLLSTSILAAKGVVKVLQAPVYRTGDSSSQILVNIRKGEVIYISENSLSNDLFYVTLTKDGRDGFIPKLFVKVIHNDIRELNDNISMENDPTDYIIDEPLPDEYPFRGRDKNKAIIGFNYGQGPENSYQYTDAIERSQINSTMALGLKFLKLADFDLKNRFYYGFHLGGRTGRNEHELEGDVFTTETNLDLTIGPIVLYTVYRRESFEIDTGIQFSFNYHRNYVSYDDLENKESEERGFTGMSLGASLFTNFVHKNSFGSKKIDIIHGPAMDFYSPYTLSAKSPANIDRFWPTDETTVAAQAVFSYNVGILYRF